MKTSNIIILSFAIVVMALTLLFFIDAKNHEKLRKNDLVIVYQKTAPFKVLVAEKNCKIDIRNGHDFSIGVYGKNNKLDNKTYRIVNDTLYISGTESMAVVCRGVNCFVSNNCEVMALQAYKTDTLHLIANGGNINVNSISTDLIKLQSVQVDATKKGRVNIYGVKAEKLSANISNESSMECRAAISNATVKVQNKSLAGFYSEIPQSLNFKRDSSSKIQIW